MEYSRVKGTRDFLPEEMIKRNKIKAVIENILKKYGFNPVETPAMEYWETLVGKYGDDEKLIYSFQDMGGRKIGLRYDLTVPIVRLFSMNKDIMLPFKPYYISRVWRYDQPGKDRYREFWQADAEIIGCRGVSADAEIIAVIDDVMKSLNIKKYEIRISDRKLFNEIIKMLGIDESKTSDILRSIDKLDKIGFSGVEEELIKKSLNDAVIKKIFAIMREGFNSLKKLENTEGYKEIQTLIKYLKKYGV
ncbi:MAG: HisS family protein, partial [Candidatus Nanoarchaeia archaeon]|nr:HisS family protein [Candidatus Nanoarchaeia archaeon]